jgi:nitrogen fixation protein FixH
MPIRKGKAESILKHPDQVGAAKENQSSAAGPSAPVSKVTISAPVITASTDKNNTTTTIKNNTAATIKNTTTSDTSGLQYSYSTPVKDPAIVLKVVNHALNVPVSITQQELLSISPEVRKQYMASVCWNNGSQ